MCVGVDLDEMVFPGCISAPCVSAYRHTLFAKTSALERKERMHPWHTYNLSSTEPSRAMQKGGGPGVAPFGSTNKKLSLSARSLALAIALCHSPNDAARFGLEKLSRHVLVALCQHGSQQRSG